MAKSLLSLGQTVLLNVTDKGIPPVPSNFPTCPIHTKEDVTENEVLVKLNTIGNDKLLADINVNSYPQSYSIVQSSSIGCYISVFTWIFTFTFLIGYCT